MTLQFLATKYIANHKQYKFQTKFIFHCTFKSQIFGRCNLKGSMYTSNDIHVPVKFYLNDMCLHVHVYFENILVKNFFSILLIYSHLIGHHFLCGLTLWL